MSADKPYLWFLVKDDLSRFFYQDGMVSKIVRDTRKDWGLGGVKAESLVYEGFGRT